MLIRNGPKLFEPKQVFVAVSKNKNQLLNSASGGVFAAVATKILKDGGGCVWCNIRF